MKRQQLLGSLAVGLLGVACSRPVSGAAAAPVYRRDFPKLGKPVRPPAHGPLNIAFVVGSETVLIDLAGPWEAFRDGMLPIRLYTVGPRTGTIDLEGLHIRPHYHFDDAPSPNVVVVPALISGPGTTDWIRKASVNADITMSICTGAFTLAETGLLDGRYATTHHDGYDVFAKKFPKVKLVRGPRYVEDRDVASAGGETSGIDLALRVVERYFGTKAAAKTADAMEHVRTDRPA